MKAAAAIVAARRGSATEIVGRRAEAPLAIRRCGDRVLLAATAAAPLGGDELDLDIAVGQAATLHVGSVAATLIWPSADGRRSSMSTNCHVADGAELQLTPEPTVSVAGSRHRIVTRVDLAPTARCRIVEELALGRSGECSGDVEMTLRVERGGLPVLHHTEHFGPSAAGHGTSVSIGGARYVVAALIVGQPAGESRTVVERAATAACLVLAADAVAVFAAGPDRSTTWSAIEEVTCMGGYGKTIRPILSGGS